MRLCAGLCMCMQMFKDKCWFLNMFLWLIFWTNVQFNLMGSIQAHNVFTLSPGPVKATWVFKFHPNSHTTIFYFSFSNLTTAASVASWDSRLPAGCTLQNLSRCIVSSGYCFPCMINTDNEYRIFRHPTYPFCIVSHRKANACCIFPQSSFLQLGELERSLEKMSTQLSRHAVSCLWEQTLRFFII